VLSTAVLVFATAAAAGTVASSPDRASAAGPVGRDTDHDGLSDDAEIRRYHTDPRKRDTDHDGLTDGAEVRRYKTNPRKPDTDRDSLADGAEVGRYHTNPRSKDTDRDRLTDGDEVLRYRTDPLKRDTDGDGYGDRLEVSKGKDPRNPRDRPGFPREDNTGVPPGTVLSPYSGPSTISTPSTVIDGKTMGCIVVTVPGVVIRNSKISCDSFYAVGSFDGTYTGAPLLIEDSEIDCQNSTGTGISEANVTVRRVNIHGCVNGFNISENITVEDSYIHDLSNAGDDPHADGIQFASRVVNGEVVKGVLNVTIRHNTIYGMGPDGSFGTSAIISNSGGDTNVLIENNLLAGGAYTLYCEANATGTNYRVINNRFSRKFGPKVGTYGPSAECSDEQQSGNVYHETGRPLRLP